MANILDSIIEYKTAVVKNNQKNFPLDAIKEKAKNQTKIRGFTKALHNSILQKRPAVIAECKKGSPSKGVIVPNYEAEKIAIQYEIAGATCLSVLTDENFFHGSNRDLGTVRETCRLPILRKDFIIDPYQVYETKGIGADCILLIVSCLSDELLEELFHISIEIGLDVLIEIHDRTELERALRLRTPLIGVNNRNLKIFETDISNTIELLKDIPDDRIVVSESGIANRQDVEILIKNNVNCFLIGETFLRSDNPGNKVRELFPELT